jgi:uncharacterized membrane protein
MGMAIGMLFVQTFTGIGVGAVVGLTSWLFTFL